MEYYQWIQLANQMASEGVCIAGGYTAKSGFANAVQHNTNEAEGYGDIDEDFYRWGIQAVEQTAMKEIEEKKDLLPSNEADFLKFCTRIEKKYAKLIHPKLRDEQAVIVPLGVAEYHIRKANEQICHRDTKKYSSCVIWSYQGSQGKGSFTDMRQKACNLITSGALDSCWIKTFPNGEKRYVEKLLSKYEVEIKSSRRKPTAQGVKYLTYNVYMIFFNGG